MLAPGLASDLSADAHILGLDKTPFCLGDLFVPFVPLWFNTVVPLAGLLPINLHFGLDLHGHVEG